MGSAPSPAALPGTESQGRSTSRKGLVVLTVAGVIAALIGVGVIALGTGGPSPGTINGTMKLIRFVRGHPASQLVFGDVFFELASNGGDVHEVHFGPSGRFTVSLSPGVWVAIENAHYGHNGQDSVGDGSSFTVTSGKTSNVTFQLFVP